MSSVEFRSVAKNFGSTQVLRNVNLTVESGEFVALLGPSGCGKSTLLRLLAGLDTTSTGEIFIDGENVADRGPAERGIGLVFQNYALYPHMTVAQNLAFPLKRLGLKAPEIEKRIDETAQMLDLRAFLPRKPAELSGGQKQRVAMGRAIIKRPKVILFDEPLSNLDAQLRARVRTEIAQLRRQIKATMLYVTHDQSEAMTLADRIAVLNAGKLEQVGRPLELYREPATKFIGSFVGIPPMNFFSAAPLRERGFTIPPEASTVGIRPNEIKIQKGSGDSLLVTMKLDLVEPLGNLTYLHGSIPGAPVAEPLIIEVDSGNEFGETLRPGRELPVYARQAALSFFDSTGRRL